MTWAEFKAEMERQGVKDSHRIEWIDCSPSYEGISVRDYTRWERGSKDGKPDDLTKSICVLGSLTYGLLHQDR